MPRTVRGVSQVALAALCSLLLSSGVAHAETKTWNLADDFPLAHSNPAADKYGHKSVWTYMYSNAKKPGQYSKLGQYYGPPTEEAACGVKDFYFWNKTKNSLGNTPAIFFNAGETVEAGGNRCDSAATYPGHTVFLHPQVAAGSIPVPADAVVRWKSTVTAMLTVSGSVQPVDPFVTGVRWELDRGSTAVAGPGEVFDDTLTSFGPISLAVKKGEDLYMRLGLAKGASGASDGTAVDLTIASP